MATKKKTVSKKKASLSGELNDLAKILSGEMQLRMKEEKMEKLKKRAVERQKDIRRKKVVRGEAVLEKDDVTEKTVVQNISLFEWEAPIRVRMPIDPKSYLITVGLCLIFIVFLAVLGHYGLMAAIVALLFFIYVAGTTEPINVKHKITSRGVDSMGKLYEWFMLDEFWYTKREDQYMLIITTNLRIPAKLIMLVSKKDMSPLFVLLQDKLLYKDIRKQGKVEKMTFGEYVPLEKI